jgi:hypothetical protein
MDGDRQRYVVIRDDDLHAYTPIECLETLYRPFLDRLQVVNLSAIPCVDTTVKLKNGLCEEYLIFNPEKTLPLAPISANPTLVDYVLQNSGYQITQHGYTHLTHEFLSRNRRDLAGRLDRGLAELSKAGFKDVCTFIAPQERLSTEALKEVSKRFALISSHWYEWRQLPVAWLPWYVVKRWNNLAHWRAGKTLLVTHQRTLFARNVDYRAALPELKQRLSTHQVVVLPTHWWEFYERDTLRPNRPMIEAYHAVSAYLAERPDVKVIRFNALIDLI